MKIAFIRYPKELYDSGKIIRGGSEIANQYVIDFLRDSGIEIIEFSPTNPKRIALIDIPAIGTPLMFQDLLRDIDKINSCDVVLTTNWFGTIIPEIKRPIITIFHSNAIIVLDVNKDEIDDSNNLEKWIGRAKKYSIANRTHQREHDKIISIGENQLAQMSNKIIAVSGFLKDSLVKSYSIDPEKIEVVFNSYPSDWTDIKIEKKFSDQKLRLTTVTRLPIDQDGFVAKAVDRIMEVNSRLSNKEYETTLLGSTKPGIYKEFLLEHIKETKFFENANRQEVGQHLARSHISLCLSRCESFGLGLTESMLMGSIPITYPTGVAKEIVENGRNGFIVSSIEEVIKKVDFLNKNRDKATKISQNAITTIKELMSSPKIGVQYLNLIKKVVKNARP